MIGMLWGAVATEARTTMNRSGLKAAGDPEDDEDEEEEKKKYGEDDEDDEENEGEEKEVPWQVGDAVEHQSR